MSVYSYVALKVHTNVWKAGTHLNVWYIERMFAESTRVCFLIRNIVLYIMNIPFSRPFSFSLSLLYYYILYLYTERGTLFPAPYPFPPLSYPFFVYPYILFIIYSIYREGYTFPQLLPLFPPFPYPLLYSYYI